MRDPVKFTIVTSLACLYNKVPKVISAKGSKKVCQVSSGNKTILGCASAI